MRNGRGLIARFVAMVIASVLLMATPSLAGATGPAVVDAHDGFSFRLPNGWQSLPPKLLDEELRNEHVALTPRFRAALPSARADLSRNTKVFAVGPDLAGSTFTPNINIQVVAAKGVPSGHAFIVAVQPQLRQEMQALGAKSYAITTTRVAGRLAAEVTASVPVTANLSGQEVAIVTPGDNTLYVLTFSTVTPTQTQAVAQQVVSTWHWR